MAPEHYIEGVKDKNIKIILSRSDRIIPYKFGKKLAIEIKQNIANTEIVENTFLGHYGTIVSFCLNPRI